LRAGPASDRHDRTPDVWNTGEDRGDTDAFALQRRDDRHWQVEHRQTQCRVVLDRTHPRGERISDLPAHGIGPLGIIKSENGDRPPDPICLDGRWGCWWDQQGWRRRRNQPPSLAAGRAEQPWRDADPERDYLKLRYGAAYEEALQAALASLSSRERLCLRLHYADGLDIGRNKIHRSTVARRLAEYRRKLRESMQERLRKRLKLTDSEFDSVLSLVRGQLVVSLRSALKNPAHPA
jgi:hypothetical protein